MKASELWQIRPLARAQAVLHGKQYRITVLTNRLLRLEYEQNGSFRDTATQAALCRDFPVPAFSVTETESLLTVETDALLLRYDKQPFSYTGLTVTLKGAFAVYGSVWHYGEENRTLGGTARTLDESNGPIPLEDGLTSIHGYAALDDSCSMGMDEEGRLLPARPHGIDLYLFAYGHDFKGCIRDYLRLSGAVPAVPRFALGNWWSRFYPYTQDSYRALMEQFRAEGIPLSVSVLDMNWHVTDIDPKYGTGWTGYSWDREKFPAAEKLLQWLHEHGLRVTLNDHPADGVRACEEMYPQMAEAMGDDPALQKSYPYDAADEQYRKAFEQAVLNPLEDQGVDFWWIDWQQKGGSSDPGMDPLFCLNHTRYLHAIEKGLPALILSRYGGPGSHRYPLGFSGDTCATWASLAFQPYFTAAAANIAYPWWSHDIGGHMHGITDPEMTVRWVQFGVFSPILRLHSSNNPFMEKEPWKYPAEKAAVMKRFLRLRHQLVPWLYSQNLKCSEMGEMLLRPMYYDVPDDPAAYGAKNQYMLGDCLTVCPITQPMDREAQLSAAEVFLPAGEWTDFFTGRRYRGGRKLKLYRPLDTLPVLVKAGGILPVDGRDVPQNGAPLPESVLWRVFPGADGEAELIEDNGKMPQDPAYSRVVTAARLRCENGMTLEILPPQGDASLLPARRQYSIEINGIADREPNASTCDYGVQYDEKRRALTLTLSGDALRGAKLQWNSAAEAPVPDWKDEVRKLLLPAQIEFDLKDRVMEAARRNDDPACFLAQLHLLPLPNALFGAILELLSAD